MDIFQDELRVIESEDDPDEVEISYFNPGEYEIRRRLWSINCCDISIERYDYTCD